MQSAQSSHPAFGDVRWLQAFAATLASDGDEADDLVQETLIEAWRHTPEDRARGLRPWLAGVLRNRFRMARRSGARRHVRESNAVTSPEAPDPESTTDRLEVLELLVGALRQLPVDERTLIARRFFDDESPAEIAASLDIPAATIRSKLHRSLKKLRLTLDDTYGDRAAWAIVVAGVPLGTPPLSTPEASSTMSIPLKIAAITIATSAMGVGGYVASRPSSDTPASTEASSQKVSQPERAAVGKPVTARERWQERRAAIRSALDTDSNSAAEPTAPAENEESPKPLSAFREAVQDCAEDSDIEGALTVSVHEIGAPDIGTIYESVSIVDSNIDDPDLLACMEESMYSYVGPTPDGVFERTIRITGTLGGHARSDETLVRAIAGAHNGEVRFCAGKHPGATGAVVFELVFDGGKFDTARVKESTIPQGLEDCVHGAVNRWKFAAAKGTLVELPFEFPLSDLPE